MNESSILSRALTRGGDKMYKILIKYNQSRNMNNLWMIHGTVIESKSGSSTVQNFVEFETDDLDVLKSEIDKLDKIYRYESIKVIKNIDYSILVSVNDSDN